MSMDLLLSHGTIGVVLGVQCHCEVIDKHDRPWSWTMVFKVNTHSLTSKLLEMVKNFILTWFLIEILVSWIL